MLSSIGPFFYIRGKLIYNACPLSEGREQAGKLDNSYGHDQLYDAHFKTGEYIDYLIIPGLSEPPVRTLRATIPENESHIFR